MRTLDVSRSYATVSPPCQIADFDRKAHFQQDGAFFDQHGRAIEAGRAAENTAAQPTASEPNGAAPAPADPERAEQILRLLADAPGMPVARLRSRTQQLLGHGCATEPREMLAALKAELGKCNAERARLVEIERLIGEAPALPFGLLLRQAKVLIGAACPAKGQAEIVAALQAALMIARGGQPAAATPPRPTFQRLPPRKEGHADDGVDLKAYAAGRVEYPFPRVQAAIKAKYATTVTSRRQAIAVINDENVVETEMVDVEDFPDS